ncbi:MAG: DNA-processing protein DprA [Chloroflexota bacterium]
MVSEREAWAVLASVHGLGQATFALLLREHGGAQRVVELAATEAGRRIIRNGPAGDRRSLPQPTVEGLAAAAADSAGVVARLRTEGIAVLTIDDDAYPARLRTVEEPPHVLFVSGATATLDTPQAIAIVGTRRPTEPGRRVAARIADALARAGAVVVSGLAVGIDGAAHAAVVAAGQPTVAVLGSGHDRLFPRAHVRLAKAIVETGGAVVSELPPDAHPSKGTFPRRNRLISGLADATVVVEAAAGSGALITARWALEQGRGCFLVPGSIDAPTSAGCLAFLRAFAGEARIVAGIAELVDDLGLVGSTRDASQAPAAGPSREAILAMLGGTEARVAAALVDGATTADDLAERTDLPIATVLGTLTLLEMRELVISAYGRYRPVGTLAAVAPKVAVEHDPVLG